jgi:hypothetical protein
MSGGDAALRGADERIQGDGRVDARTDSRAAPRRSVRSLQRFIVDAAADTGKAGVLGAAISGALGGLVADLQPAA